MDTSFIRLELDKNNSKKYDLALKYLNSLPHVYSRDINTRVAYVCDLDEFVRNRNAILRFIEIAGYWKTARIFYEGKRHRLFQDFQLFMEKVLPGAGKYAPCLRMHVDFDGKGIYVAENGEIVFESQLPLPFVYYPGGGIFFAFAKDLDSKPYFCSCQKELIAQANNWSRFPSSIPNKFGISEKSRPVESLCFCDSICFKCRKVQPSLLYRHPMYVSSFESKYGWYIDAMEYALGLYVANKIKGNSILEALYKEKRSIMNRLVEVNGGKLIQIVGTKKSEMEPSLREAVELTKAFHDAAENATRVELGFKKIGDGWVSETILYHIVEGIFPDEIIVRHFRPDWLDRLELDIWIPGKKMAIEYQGIQHYESIEHWGGEAGLLLRKEHDERKARLCKEHGIKLVAIKYNEELSTEYIGHRLLDSQLG